MGRRSVLRWVVLTVLTLALAASIVTMFVVRGVVDEVWVYASLALYGMALLVYWLILAGSRPAAIVGRDEIAEKVALALASGQGTSTATMSEPEPEIVVEPSRREPIVLPTMVPSEPAGYTFRGYTLYGRGDSRFFSKGTPPGAQAIELPPGYEAKWDEKREKPVLVGIVEPEPEVALEVQQKPCGAMVSPGEFCENLAKAGSRFCAKHVDFSSDEELFEVRKSPTTAKSGKAAKSGAPQIEVRHDSRAAKPFTFRPSKQPSIEAKVARPSNTKALEYKRGKPVEIKLDKASTKPFKPGSLGSVVVQTAKPSDLRPIKFRRANEPVVRLAKPSGAKPVKFGKAVEPTVRVAKPPEPKPLRFTSAVEPTVRSDHVTPVKPKSKGLPRSELVVRSPTLPKPPAKGKQLAPSEIVVRRPVVARAPKGKRLAPSEVIVKTAAAKAPPKGKQLSASEVVVKTPAAKGPPKGKQLSASEVVVKTPGTVGSKKPLRFGTQDFNVRSGRDAKPVKPIRAKEPEIVVVKDTKRRSMLGVEGEAPKKS